MMNKNTTTNITTKRVFHEEYGDVYVDFIADSISKEEKLNVMHDVYSIITESKEEEFILSDKEIAIIAGYLSKYYWFSLSIFKKNGVDIFSMYRNVPDYIPHQS